MSEFTTLGFGPLVAPSVCLKQRTHSCIVVEVGNKYVYYIPMEDGQIELKKAEREQFIREYQVHPDYPVQRAAKLYLGSYQQISPQARERLEQIAGDPKHQYNPDELSSPQSPQQKGKTMATTQTANPVANKPVVPAWPPVKAAKPAEKIAKAAPAKPTAKVAKAAPAKPTAKVAKAAPAKPTAKVAKAAPAKPTAPAWPAVKAASAKSTEKAAPGKPAVAKTPATAKTTGAPKGRTVDNTTKYKVVNPDKAKRGDMLLFVQTAQKLKTFTRPQLLEACEKTPGFTDAYRKAPQSYMAWCLRNEMFAPV